mmetsp:Transcript_36324/g.100832  ORF Transcript_36324/g.100832 Transcript_36324/m.100832 type:complete len:242 (+) Transcript_36324:88-813(+)
MPTNPFARQSAEASCRREWTRPLWEEARTGSISSFPGPLAAAGRKKGRPASADAEPAMGCALGPAASRRGSPDPRVRIDSGPVRALCKGGPLHSAVRACRRCLPQSRAPLCHGFSQAVWLACRSRQAADTPWATEAAGSTARALRSAAGAVTSGSRCAAISCARVQRPASLHRPPMTTRRRHQHLWRWAQSCCSPERSWPQSSRFGRHRRQTALSLLARSSRSHSSRSGRRQSALQRLFGR